jgi:hypothetical protein
MVTQPARDAGERKPLTDKAVEVRREVKAIMQAHGLSSAQLLTLLTE